MNKFHTQILTNEIKQTISGLNKAASVIISTMGGTGKNVILSNNNDEIVFTKDGVSVAKKIRFSNAEENIGAQLLINAANKTVEECGDGTTLTCLFTKEFINNLFDDNTMSKANVNDILEDVESHIEKVIQKLKDSSVKIDSPNDIYRIALTSSKSSRIAKFIHDIYLKTGLNANIAVEMSRANSSTYYEISEGLHFEDGFVHPSFANQDNNTCIFEKPFFIITDSNVQSPDDYSEILDQLHNDGIPVVFIAPSFSDAFVRYCLTNKRQVGLQVCLIRTPGYGASVGENIKDMKAFINSDGTANKFVASPIEFTIYNQVDKDRLKKRIEQLTRLAEGAIEEYDEKDYLNRIHALQQSSAIIYVGGVTDKNAKEEYDRIEDAVGAVKSSLKLGYVKGAGVALANIETEHELLRRIIRRPYFQILENANIFTDEIKSEPLNVRTFQLDENIIDPTHVIINALENSFALAKLLINTSYIVHNE